MIRRILKPLASLKLTVVLFVLAMVLVFAGTLAQVHEGIWTVVDQYFRSFFVRIPLQIFIPKSILETGLGFWFPGGITLGVLILINLLAAHITRFKFKMNRIGIIVTHLGVILLLLGEFVTGFAAREGHMTIREGETVNFTEDYRTTELAVIDQSDPNEDFVVVVPEYILKSENKRISNSLLPFSIEVSEWMPNSQILGPMQDQGARKGLADSGQASTLAAIPAPIATGVDGQTVNVPSAYITLFKDGKRLGSYLVSVYLEAPQQVVVDGKAYWIALRFERSYKPYALHLIDFKHDKFTGTQMARNFSSEVQLIDDSRNVNRRVLIYMNHPLRYSGETFYQASFLKGDGGTVLQVVQNPGWIIPYVSSSVITIGMLIHFGMRLMPRKRRVAS